MERGHSKLVKVSMFNGTASRMGPNWLPIRIFLLTASGTIESYTHLPASWFRDKTILDAGCGNGRWAYIFSKMGARVTAIDQSEHGLNAVRQLCAEFPGFKAVAHNLLEPLPLGAFDFVWSYGVLHHTGNTRTAFENIVPMVKPGGKLFLMIYGEPTRDGEFAEIAEYFKHRHATSYMSYADKVAYLKGIYREELVHGYFDAISPSINDLYRFDEIRSWLGEAGFVDVKRTIDSRNLHIMASRQ